MGQFKSLVDRTITLVRDKGEVSLAALAYLLEVSPDYARKVARSAVDVSPDPMMIESVWHKATFKRDPPVLFLKSHFDAKYRGSRPGIRPTWPACLSGRLE